MVNPTLLGSCTVGSGQVAKQTSRKWPELLNKVQCTSVESHLVSEGSELGLLLLGQV